jgi:hypothetical protein
MASPQGMASANFHDSITTSIYKKLQKSDLSYRFETIPSLPILACGTGALAVNGNPLGGSITCILRNRLTVPRRRSGHGHHNGGPPSPQEHAMTGVRFLPVALALCAGLLLGGCSKTQEASKATAAEDVTEVKLIPAYESLDKDKDGIVTLAEVDAVAPDWAERMHACDTDHDKTLTRGEYDVCKQTTPAAH